MKYFRVMIVIVVLILVVADIHTSIAQKADVNAKVSKKEQTSKINANYAIKNESRGKEQQAAEIKTEEQKAAAQKEEEKKYLIQLSYAMLAIGGLVLLSIFILLLKNNYSQDFILKLIVISLILVGTLFCIASGADNNKIAPALGLFGTIAGYLLGKREEKDSQVSESRSGGSNAGKSKKP